MTLSAEVPANTAAATPLTVTLTAASLDATNTAEAEVLERLDATPAEDGDFTIPDAVSNADGLTRTLEFEFPANTTNDSERHTLTQSFEVQTRNTDSDAEHEGFRVSLTNIAGATVNGPDGSPVSATPKDIKINDKDPQAYDLVLMPATQSPKEGDMVTVQISAVPPHVQGSERLTINIDKSAPDYTFEITSTDTNAAGAIDDNQVVIGNAATADQVATATITLTTPANDMNRLDDTVMMTAHSGQPGAGMLEDSLPIVLADQHKLPAITAALTDANGMAVTDGRLTEGNTYTLTLSAPAAVSEDITVSVTKASGTADPMDDYSLGQSLIMIPNGQSSSAGVSLEVDLNDDIEDDTLVFMAEVVGEVANGTETDTIAMLLSLTLVDATTKLVTVATDAMQTIYDAIDVAEGDDGKLNRGERITLMKSALFDPEPATPSGSMRNRTTPA